MFELLRADSRQKNRLILLAIIGLTLPGYCLGVVLLISAQDDKPTAPRDPTQTAVSLALDPSSTLTATETATTKPTPTSTPTQTETLTPAPTPSATRTPTASATPILPTITPSPTLNPTETLTDTPTATETATLTPTPTPTLTQTPFPLPSLTPLPSATPTPPDDPGPITGGYSLWGCTANVGPGTPPLLNPISPSEASYTWIQGIWMRVHEGVDLAIPMGTPIHAAGGGTVVFAGWSTPGYGNAVVVAHGETFTLYGHLSRIDVTCDQRIAADDVIGLAGSTGWSSGPHLHFEVRDTHWGVLNPQDFIGF